MRILITNDDGIHAEGLQVLERIARTLSDDVWVVAPEQDQSGVAHALTLSDPLRVRVIAPQHFAVRGTPTDCIIIALNRLMKGMKPDLVLSGVNRGENLADDVTYSGTVAGAIEGAQFGVPAFALSQAYEYDDREGISWATAEQHAPELLKTLLKRPMARGTLLNINFPHVLPADVKGVQFTRQGFRSEEQLRIESRNDGRGFPYYWLGFNRCTQEFLEGTDLHAVENGFISVTPLHLDLTDYKTLVELRDLGI